MVMVTVKMHRIQVLKQATSNRLLRTDDDLAPENVTHNDPALPKS
jgi:hypothetical protein